MDASQTFSCFIIGGDTLLIECAEILLQKGHDIRGVITDTARISVWAKEKQIAVLDAKSPYQDELAAQTFDYLFSITHLERIPDQVLAMASKMAINFHDGPLPRYAGLNAPVWAIVNGEDEYGITWHMLSSTIDEGDIVAQKKFAIAADETALSLNTKCFAAALETFPQLVSALADNTIQRQEQDRAQRSYFGKHKSLPAAGFLDWHANAHALEAMIRSLNYGPYSNPLGCAKLIHENQALIVTAATVDEQNASAPPGTIVAIDDEALTIACAEGHLLLSAFSTLTGQHLTLSEVVQQYALAPDQRLTVLDTELTQSWQTTAVVVHKAEAFWLQRLRTLTPPEISIADITEHDQTGAQYDQLALALPDAFGEQFSTASGDACIATFALWLARIGQQMCFDLAYSDTLLRQQSAEFQHCLADELILRVDIDGDDSGATGLDRITTQLGEIRNQGAWWRDLIARQPDLVANPELQRGHLLPISIVLYEPGEVVTLSSDSALIFAVCTTGREAFLRYDQRRVSAKRGAALQAQFSHFLLNLSTALDTRLSALDLLSANERQQILHDWNQTDKPYASDTCVHQLFEQQAAQRADNIALVFEQQQLSYRELNQRANQLAHYLLATGLLAPDVMVGVNIERSPELMIATLAVLKTGAAYVPLDPAFPEQRIAFMIEDANMAVIISQDKLQARLPTRQHTRVLCIDKDWSDIAQSPTDNPEVSLSSTNLAYVIYTSGSTGKPKGVMVEHRNVVNFFTGMDDVIQHDPPGTWLAVTSLSFDISVLELFWTLSRGFKVVLYQDRERGDGQHAVAHKAMTNKAMAFGLFMWGNDDGPGRAKYHLMLEGAKYFDDNGFHSVWTPERHFHAFGGPYPNPAVTGAAIAALTKNLHIRAGSCVSPLHHPVRIAEEWSVVDNLCNGRVGIAFASGWQPNDFVIKPENHQHNKTVMLEQIETVRKLWRGEKVSFINPLGDAVAVETLPRPVQPELPIWITSAGNPDTYRQAGTLGANVLTHLLGQSIDEVADKIRIYRQARSEAGFDPASGQVTLMLHTFVGADDAQVRELVRQPMKDYLRSSMKLVLGFAWSFPAFKRPGGTDSALEDVDIENLSDEESEAILEFAFERYFETSGLFGTAQTCLKMVDQCKAAGVDEIACLLDFGVDTEDVMQSLPYLKQLKELANQSLSPAEDGDIGDDDYTVAAQIKRHQVSHLQCTPSMARMLTLDQETHSALASLQHLLIGGEAFAQPLAQQLGGIVNGKLSNMYGPTETTIWSTTETIAKNPNTITIGRPIANTQIYILDRYLQPVPIGVSGELYIAGDGVVRGYWNRPELNNERFISDPFASEGKKRLYRTGDLARYRADGTIEFLGRVDFQVKIRGYRIELGEIETLLGQADGVSEAVVIVHEDTPSDQRLVAYLIARDKTLDAALLREQLRQKLPEYMVPSDFIVLAQMPLTPNGKIDRKALPAQQTSTPTTALSQAEYVAPENELEQSVAELWRQVLKHEQVGIDDNFFDLGGHSLLIVQLHRELGKTINQTVSLTSLYRFPTIRAFSQYVTSGDSTTTLKQSTDRAQRRRERMLRRRGRA